MINLKDIKPRRYPLPSILAEAFVAVVLMLCIFAWIVCLLGA